MYLGAATLGVIFVMVFTFDSFFGLMKSFLEFMPCWIQPIYREISWEDAYLQLNSELSTKRSERGLEAATGNFVRVDNNGRDTRGEATRFSTVRSDPHASSREAREMERTKNQIRLVAAILSGTATAFLVVLSLVALYSTTVISSEARAMTEK